MTTACASGDAACIKTLIGTQEMKDFYVQMATDGAGNTPIMAALKGGRGGGLDMLLSNGAVLPPFPLHIAAAAPRSGALRWLLGRPGVNVDEKNPRGYAPLHVAAEANRVGCIRALLDAGADEALESGDGETAATIAEAMDNTAAYEFFMTRFAPRPDEEAPDVSPRPEEVAAAAKAADAAAASKARLAAKAPAGPAVHADDLMAALGDL